MKAPKCPLAEERIKMWYVYTIIYYSAIKDNEIMPFATTWMDLAIIILNEASQRQIPYDIIYKCHIKKYTNEFIYKTETDPQTENKVVSTKGESGWGRGALGD